MLDTQTTKEGLNVNPDKVNEEWYCNKCGEGIDAPMLTGLLCSECWLEVAA